MVRRGSELNVSWCSWKNDTKAPTHLHPNYCVPHVWTGHECTPDAELEH